MPTRTNKRKTIFRVLIAVTIVVMAVWFYLLWLTRERAPKIDQASAQIAQVQDSSGSMVNAGHAWFRKNSSGLYEMYVEGSPYQRGLVNGQLSKQLIGQQEAYFHEEINRLIPSRFYLRFLKYFVAWFNRDLQDHVPLEYQQEIYGISKSAPAAFEYVGSPFQRMLNYHAAHDIGHALQNMMLVGCTSMAVWGGRSADGSMLIGRNFDFYAGDKFAQDKIVSFVRPDQGFPFMSVTWGGFIGVVSGMNNQGLTVTINAAKSDLPKGSATPVSLVAREILQYAANISDALRIAKRRRMFVSESFLIGSAADRRAVIIEKTPDSISVYDAPGQSLLCTNHFQSEGLRALPSNQEQISASASTYRYQRLQELMEKDNKHSVASFALVLRDRLGQGDRDIGVGNEKAINQFIAHHSVIFQPEQLRVWVSTNPWQLGSYRAYDLKQIFSCKLPQAGEEVSIDSLSIPQDAFMQTDAYRNFLAFRAIRHRFLLGRPIDGDSAVKLNPEYYYAYSMAGDEAMRRESWEQAVQYFRTGLTKEIATVAERKHMEEGLSTSMNKIKHIP